MKEQKALVKIILQEDLKGKRQFKRPQLLCQYCIKKDI